MAQLLVADELELLKVACAVDFVGGAHCLIDTLFLGAQDFADFGECGLRDCVVEMADAAVGILGDLALLGSVPTAQGVHSFFKLIHTVVCLAFKAGV